MVRDTNRNFKKLHTNVFKCTKSHKSVTELSDESHLDEAERVVFLHEAFDATADLLETSLVLADPGDVLLNRLPVGVALRACALLQSGDELAYFCLHLLTQSGQAVLAVINTLLQDIMDVG